MEQDELDRLFGLFMEMKPSMAEEWASWTRESGLLPEVRKLAYWYARQNEAIHRHCQQCDPNADCPPAKREEDWINDDGPKRFFCGDSPCEVSIGAWNAFILLLRGSVHAAQCAKEIHRDPTDAELDTPAFRDWNGRLSGRMPLSRS
jgi:hypothetical protein